MAGVRRNIESGLTGDCVVNDDEPRTDGLVGRNIVTYMYLLFFLNEEYIYIYTFMPLPLKK